MDEQEFSQLIDTSLVAILSGRASLEDILKQHPAEAELLRPELEAALWLVAQQEQVSARPGFVAASRKRVVARIRQESTNRGTKRAFLGFLWPRQMAMQWAMLGLVMVLIFGISGGLISASQGAVPGESLYPIKRAAEQLSFDLSPYPEGRVALSAQFIERRLFEAEVLILNGSYGPAQATLSEFEQEIQRSVELLAQVPDTKAEQKRQLALSLTESLENKTERIENLAKVVPDAVGEDLNRAKFKSTTSAMLAMSIVEEIDKNIGTPTVPVPVVELTATPTVQVTLPPTSTTGEPQPQSTPVPPSTDPTAQPTEPIRGEVTDEPPATAQPTDDTPVGEEIKPSKTPKPTNDNIPPRNDKPTATPAPENTPTDPKPDTPPGDPSPQPDTPPGNSEPNPNKPTDKPTKEPNPNKPTDKPTKEPNPNKPTDQSRSDKPTKEPNPNKPTDQPQPENPLVDPGSIPDTSTSEP